MSRTDPDEIVVTGGDLTVKKRLDRERFEHLGVIYEIRSDRSDRVDLRLVDTVPASVPVGLHPQYHGVDWSMGERNVVFERTLQPDEELTTLYGLGTGANESIDQFRTEPTIEFRPNGHDEYTRLEMESSPADQLDRSKSARSPARSSISDLAAAVGAMDMEADPVPSHGSAMAADRSARTALESATRELRPALRESIDELESIVTGLGSDPEEQLESASARQAVDFHVEAILFHIAHLREDLPTQTPSPVRESDSDTGTDASQEAEASADAMPTSDSSAADTVETQGDTAGRSGVLGRLDVGFGPGHGIPFLWIVTLLGLWTVLSGVGLLGGPSRDLLLAGTGGLAALVSAFGWLYPEEKQPVTAVLAVVVACGLAIMVYPFLLGAPRSITGVVTIGAGVLITTIPMIVENRRWQSLGILER